MGNIYIERLYGLLLGLKNDKDLMNNIKEVKNYKEALNKHTLVESGIFLYNNGNLSTTEKKEILSNVKEIYESLNNEHIKTKRR